MSLAVLAPLRLEAWALGARRTGMGVRAADVRGYDAVAIGGLCGAVHPSLRPGDVVVASELRDLEGLVVECPYAASLVPLLRERGLRVAFGTIVSASRILGPAERARLDALAVDMESVWLAHQAEPRPVAVIRAVVDRAGRRLLDPRTPFAGVRGLLSLRRAAPALAEWGAGLSAPPPEQAKRVVFPRPEEVSG